MKFNPSKVVCVGLNYSDHADELKMKRPDHPILFLKPTTAVISDNDAIVYPEGHTKNLHYEAELAIVIGKKIHKASESEAKAAINGYTCANDVTARDIQNIDGQWTRAKGFDTFCPIGPDIVSGINTDDLAIRAILNGKTVQDSRTSLMIFKPVYLVSFISQIMTLLPNDIILTGTPTGVGPMQKGDTIVIEIENIGRLTNKVI